MKEPVSQYFPLYFSTSPSISLYGGQIRRRRIVATHHSPQIERWFGRIFLFLFTVVVRQLDFMAAALARRHFR
jgi:hypothetical protein